MFSIWKAELDGAIDWFRELSGEDLSETYVTRYSGENGTRSQYDMHLPYHGAAFMGEGVWSREILDNLQALDRWLFSGASHDFETVAETVPNNRWLNANRHTANIIRADILSGNAADYNHVPGVNDSGLDEDTLDALAEAYAVEGKMVFTCHSAGTQTCLETIKMMTQEELEDTIFVFMSPRMEFSQFDAIVENKLNRNQAIVIGSRKDFYHWADPSYVRPVSNSAIIDVGFLAEYHEVAVFDYLDNPDPSYRMLFLNEDLTAERDDSVNPILDHPAMIKGALQGHDYEFFIDNRSREVRGITINEAFRMLIAGDFDEN